jgi:hypothetical protein
LYVQLMTTDAISPPIQSLLELFTNSLADVRFADLDGQTLARLAAGVSTAADTVATAQATLDAAREALSERQETLLHQSQRALAYARVFAESDETRTAQLEAIALPRPARRARADQALVLSAEPQPPSRPRGRPRKAPADEPMLESLVATAEV